MRESALTMNVLLVYAHPEPRSLNGSLRDFTVSRLEGAGHEVQVSDLYAMRWKASVDAADFGHEAQGERLFVSTASGRAYETGTQSADITAEQGKLLQADALILQFPLWWFSMPAILKGWIDRVYAYGLAYGVGEHSERKWGERYGEGRLAGKRAMLIITAGGWESHYSQRGINGRMEDILFPIQHGMLYFPGFDVLPPYVAYKTDHLDPSRHQQVLSELGARLDAFFSTAPIAYRRQNGGDYEIPSLTLKAGLSPDRHGLDIHKR